MPRGNATAHRSLKEYQAKRDFTRTPEPSGKGRAAKTSDKGEGRFFCVQKHLASHLHYDFRLEHDGVLLSWAVPKGPSLKPAEKRLAMRVEDHPLDYGQFEGVIPEGYGAGIVLLWDRGTWAPLPPDADVAAALEKGELKFTLDGAKLKGSWVLVRTKGGGGGRADAAGRSRTWLLIKHRDRWAGDVDVTAEFPLSVKSSGDFADVLAADDPQVWKSHRPAEGGEAGAMLAAIIEEAAKLKARRAAKRPAAPPEGPPTKRPTAKARAPRKTSRETGKRR